VDELERAWWEEEADLSAGPAEQGQGGRYSDRADEAGPTSWQVQALHIPACASAGCCHAALRTQWPAQGSLQRVLGRQGIAALHA
jgi:hypothetical protein